MEVDKLFGTYVRMHRSSKNIKLEVMAYRMSINKGKLSKLETGSTPWSDEDKKNVLSYLNIGFDENLHRKNIQEMLIKAYKMYAKLDDNYMYNYLKRILDNTSLEFSICYVEYYLAQYMHKILISKDISNIENIKRKIQGIKSYFSKIEYLIYEDLRGLELYQQQQYIKAIEQFQKVSKAKNELLSMMGYAHLNLTLDKKS